MIPKKYEKYQKVVTIACVNFYSVWGDKDANLKKMKEQISQAADQGVNIIAFPELALSGYDCDEGCEMHQSNAETIPGPSTEEIWKLAKEKDIYVIFGMSERDKNDSKIRYISSAVVGSEGILGSYRKLHLGGPPVFTEAVCFRGGDGLPIFETRYGPIGVQICYDFWIFPELSRILALKGARLIINTSASPSGPGKPYFIVQQTGARATENMVYAASSNLVGKQRIRSFYGHSTIAGPSFPRLAHIYAEGGEDEEIVIATLNFERLHRLWEMMNWQKDRRSEIILREMEGATRTTS